MDALHAAWKFIRSFFGSDWELSDYPVPIRQVDADPRPQGRLGSAFTWSAQIVNWRVIGGHGYSRAEALQELRANFARRKATADPLPRELAVIKHMFNKAIDWGKGGDESGAADQEAQGAAPAGSRAERG